MKRITMITLATLACSGAMLLAGCNVPATTTSPASPAVSNSTTSSAAPASPVAASTNSTGTAHAAATQPATAGTYIGEEAAKETALAHAGLRESDVTFVHVELDYDDGHWEYEVEFYSGSTEYDYDIDALTGEICSWDQDAEYICAAPASTQQTNGTYIGEAEATRIALEHAGLTESEVNALHSELDIDDGRAEYEVEWHVGQTEYSYEIDAVSGNILSHEVDHD